jgi:hypothetical protein
MRDESFLRRNSMIKCKHLSAPTEHLHARER